MNFKHLTIAPDGTLILKDQTRPKGCTLQGTVAIIKCAAEGMKQPNSQLVAVNQATLEVMDSIELPEPATSPHIVTTFEGRIAIYVSMDTIVQRAFWDPATKKLSLDADWIMRAMAPGQSAATAATVIGDWIAVVTNGIGSETIASSLVVARQNDAKSMKILFPFGKELKKGEWSFAMPKPGGDAENGMLYIADMGLRKVGGVNFDAASGDLKTAFVIDLTTTGFQPMIGPKDKRVLMLTNMKPKVDAEPIKLSFFTQNYTEQVTWRDAATGKLLAESDFFEPMPGNGLIVPAFGGRFYYPTAAGKGFYVLQVMPKATAPSGK